MRTLSFSFRSLILDWYSLQVQDFLKRFPGIPDILELDHLTVSGDVWFGRGVSLKVRLLSSVRIWGQDEGSFGTSGSMTTQYWPHVIALLPFRAPSSSSLTTATESIFLPVPFWRTKSFRAICVFWITRPRSTEDGQYAKTATI